MTKNSQILNTISKGNMTEKGVSFSGEGNGSNFTSVEIHQVSSAPTLYGITI
jgi:hypothetical protein